MAAVGSPVAAGYWVSVDGVEGFVQVNGEGIISAHSVDGRELTRSMVKKLISVKVVNMIRAYESMAEA